MSHPVHYLPLALPLFLLLTPQERFDLELAVLPLPSEMRENASVVAALPSGDLDVLREGSNHFFCIADQPGDAYLTLECHPESLKPYILRRNQARIAEDREQARAELEEDIRSGSLVVPMGAFSRWISGEIEEGKNEPELVQVWSEMALPFIPEGITGLPTERDKGGPVVMGAGTGSGHVMIDWSLEVPWSELR